MKIGINDRIVEKMMRLNTLASKKIEASLKGEKPFAMEKVSIEDRIKQYLEFTPEVEEMLVAGGIPKEYIQDYHKKMHDLMRRRYG